MTMKLLATFTVVIGSFISPCYAFNLVTPSVSSLIKQNEAKISKLEEVAALYPDAPSDKVYYLRYCIPEKGSDEDMISQLKSNLEWRSDDGKVICESARAAVDAATSTADIWDNTPVISMAPYSEVASKFITSAQCITTTSRQGDLVYIVRAGKIDDVSLMSELTVEQLTDFLLYCREVNSIVANARSIQKDRLVSLIVANDLTGLKFGGDATFQKALSATSAKSNKLYPALAGPTLLLNLPGLLGFLVKIFTPLFPREVRKKIVFAKGPLRDVSDLADISVTGGTREKFMSDLDELVYK